MGGGEHPIEQAARIADRLALVGLGQGRDLLDDALPALLAVRFAAAWDYADPAAIVLTLRGIKSSEGKHYQTALAEVLGLIREGVRG